MNMTQFLKMNMLINKQLYEMKSVFQSTEMDSLCQTYVTGFKLDQNHSGFTSSIYLWDRFVSFFNFRLFCFCNKSSFRLVETK